MLLPACLYMNNLTIWVILSVAPNTLPLTWALMSKVHFYVHSFCEKKRFNKILEQVSYSHQIGLLTVQQWGQCHEVSVYVCVCVLAVSNVGIEGYFLTFIYFYVWMFCFAFMYICTHVHAIGGQKKASNSLNWSYRSWLGAIWVLGTESQVLFPGSKYS